MTLSAQQLIQIRKNWIQRKGIFTIHELARVDQLKVRKIDEKILELNAQAELDHAMDVYERQMVTI